jgi:opacity protein-like surface antigen
MLVAIIACTALTATAQTTTSDDYDKVNFFAGFSHNRVDTGLDSNEDPEFDDIVDEREGYNGFNTSVTGNLSRYVGLKGDYSFHRNTQNFNEFLPGFEIKTDLHNFVGGVQIKDNSKERKVKPFAHLMAGVAHVKFNISGISQADLDDLDINDTETGFAGIVGGGIDFRINDRLDFRAVQFDYNPTRLDDQTQHNFRIGIGIVIK